jgi:hypothetical protein
MVNMDSNLHRRVVVLSSSLGGLPVSFHTEEVMDRADFVMC